MTIEQLNDLDRLLEQAQHHANTNGLPKVIHDRLQAARNITAQLTQKGTP